MLYKPNYCCNCGEKIERVEWHLWTNRRFCSLCETEYQLDDWLKRIFPIIFFVFGIFGIGSYFQSSEIPIDVKQSEKQTAIQNESGRKFAKPKTLKSSVEPKDQIEEPSHEHGTKMQEEPLEPNVTQGEESQQVVKVRSRQKSSNETVYFCGAETKKGTPCSRKVKGGGRCWQHKGREAMLPTNELLAEQN